MTKGLCGMKVTVCGKCSVYEVAGRKSCREGWDATKCVPGERLLPYKTRNEKSMICYFIYKELYAICTKWLENNFGQD